MKLTRRDLFATSSIALASISRAFGQTPPAPQTIQAAYDELNAKG